jgi:hypothetical protein
MRYVRPDESWVGATVAGTVDATYVNTWLCLGDPSHPVRGTNLSLTATRASAIAADVVAVCHHNIPVGATVTALGGAIPTSAWPGGRIPRNWVRRLETPTTTAAITLAVTGGPYVVGELYAGKSRTLACPLFLGREVDGGALVEWEGLGLHPPFSPGVSAARRASGETLVTESELRAIEAWWEATDSGRIPSLVIPDDAVNDAWLAVFRYTATDEGPGMAPGSPSEPEALFRLQLEIVEIPRIRW